MTMLLMIMRINVCLLSWCFLIAFVIMFVDYLLNVDCLLNVVVIMFILCILFLNNVYFLYSVSKYDNKVKLFVCINENAIVCFYKWELIAY